MKCAFLSENRKKKKLGALMGLKSVVFCLSWKAKGVKKRFLEGVRFRWSWGSGGANFVHEENGEGRESARCENLGSTIYDARH